MPQTIHVAHSPDSDDAFMFYALAEGKIDTGDLRYAHELSDIESLNQRARNKELDVSAVSIHAYAYLADDYALLNSGSSMGDGYGPRLVSKAANGAETERVIANATSLPEVLVCDHRMPDIDGLSLLRKLRQRMPDVPAILISAYLETDGSPPGHEIPFSERLPKPFAPDALVARVHAAARRYRESRETPALQCDTST